MAGAFTILENLFRKIQEFVYVKPILAITGPENEDGSPSQSALAKLNLTTIEEMQEWLKSDPDADLNEVFPRNFYARRRQMEIQSNQLELKRNEPPMPPPPEFREKLDRAEEANILFPLSNTVEELLVQYANDEDSELSAEQKLLSRLKRMVRDAPKLWENPVRGVVVKCSDEIAVKVLKDRKDYTEYTALQHLKENLPDIPIPSPHGLITFKPFCAIFMTYIPSMTLTNAWPTLSRQGKTSVQKQLDDIFRELRSLPCKGGQLVGGIGGYGVKSNHFDFAYKNPISSASEFENLQFSANHRGSKSYVKFLRSFLPSPSHSELVFSHGDVRQDNIMVKLEDEDTCTITGIIDWEDSGYYPEYHECIMLSQTLNGIDETDWYEYLPGSISPVKFPIRWLVDRLWGIHQSTT